MNFRLTYDGPLKAASQSDTRRIEKHQMRSVFNHQLLQLLGSREVLINELARSLRNAMKTYKRGAFAFFPLIREDLHLVCDLDILFLRRENPGSLICGGGDLDNRIKVLFDALRIPQDDNEVRGLIPTCPEEEPFMLTLTEDDRLITGFRCVTDRLLEPAQSVAQENDVRLIINVEVKATRLTAENLGFFSHF